VLAARHLGSFGRRPCDVWVWFVKSVLELQEVRSIDVMSLKVGCARASRQSSGNSRVKEIMYTVFTAMCCLEPYHSLPKSSSSQERYLFALYQPSRRQPPHEMQLTSCRSLLAQMTFSDSYQTRHFDLSLENLPLCLRQWKKSALDVESPIHE
jgi:hypothetical protein